jgi:ribosomal protein S18 acetylase RimI-like enzyme
MGDILIRPSRHADLGFIVELERHPENRELIGQWSDALHLAAIAREDHREHWIIERDARAAGYLIAFDGRHAYGGIYVKRILVAEKERGTGRAALARYLEDAFRRPGTSFVWLNVREVNARAQSVYRGLGFTRYAPGPEEAARLATAGEAPSAGAFSMRLDNPSPRDGH